MYVFLTRRSSPKTIKKVRLDKTIVPFWQGKRDSNPIKKLKIADKMPNFQKIEN